MQIIRQPVFIVACLGAVTAYAVMNLSMGATPLAMQICGLPYPSAALVIEGHIIGMFAPAFFAGWLVQRFGVLRIMMLGVLTYFACIAAALSGQTALNFCCWNAARCRLVFPLRRWHNFVDRSVSRRKSQDSGHQ